MVNGYRIFNHSSADLSLYECGIEDCTPCYTYGPRTREHYIFHYILSGKGTFCAEGKEYALGQNDLFLILPHQSTVYTADKKDPWSYVWVGFNGLKAESYVNNLGLSAEQPVLHYTLSKDLKKPFIDMIEAPSLPLVQEAEQLASFYHILSLLFENETNTSKKITPSHNKELYLRKALNYIDMHYTENISISEIANFVSVDRTYLFNIFKNMLNMSPQQFLLSYRISKAALMLEFSNLSVSEIASYVGYSDPLTFSKMFKKSKHLSPLQYRKKKRLSE